ncbi:MAG: single-stranded-DNA-specific exonuclease RecJ [Alphaproteobacteria bacterium]|nr:single-stranded-DNA-specific exonuclease RecJ [Alphaproteobacteria bacterium]
MAIGQRTGIPDILARVLSGRGVDVESAEDFITPTLRNALPDPFHLKDMDKAAARLAKAVTTKETIGIFGDYDVDGATSTALITRFLAFYGLTPQVHIPDRQKEGYGPNVPALLGLQAKGATLVITVDCGTASHAPLQAAKEAGLDVLVIDHHIGDVALPPAVAVVNPNRFDEDSPHGHMAAVGVTFLFLVATNKLLREQGLPTPNPLDWLDMVALGTVCDVVPLKGVNRAFVSQGLKVLVQRRNVGLATLADVGRLDESPAAYHLGFILGPRINAGGRVGKSELGAKLLATEDYAEALAIAQQLDRFNVERKTLETLALEDALAQAESRADDAVIIVDGNWHSGVIGIVAGRLKEKYHKPAAVIAWEEGADGKRWGKASARSVSGVDFGSAVVAARQSEIVVAGGGHAMAAGFTVAPEKLEELREFLCKRLADGVVKYGEDRALVVDAVLTAKAATAELVEKLKDAEPFGMGNPGPKFAFENLRLAKADLVGENHIRCFFEDGGIGGKAAGGRLQGIAFRAIGTPLEAVLVAASKGKPLHVAGSLKLNTWQGNTRVDLHIEDASLAE